MPGASEPRWTPEVSRANCEMLNTPEPARQRSLHLGKDATSGSLAARDFGSLKQVFLLGHAWLPLGAASAN
jgi:hypothetical protein